MPIWLLGTHPVATNGKLRWLQRSTMAQKIVLANHKEDKIRHLPGRERQGIHEKQRWAAGQADELTTCFPWTRALSGVIALTAGNPAHAHAVGM